MWGIISFLERRGLLHPAGHHCLDDCFDVGCGDFYFSNILSKKGYRIRAIDCCAQTKVPSGVEFSQVAIEDFIPDRQYQLIFARNVLPFTDNPLKQARRLISFLGSGGIIYVTLFGISSEYV
jgi:trans-aconitate methyltransferase